MITVAASSFPNRKEDRNNAVDFSIYYCAAQIIRQGLGRQLYDLNLQTAFQSKVAAVHVFYNHPPFEALFYVPFTYLSYRSAYIAWTFVSILLLAFSTSRIARTTNAVQALSQYIRMPADSPLLFAIFLTFAPVTTCLLLGQDSLLIVSVAALAFGMICKRSDFWAGCVLAVALFKFHLILPVILVYALRGRWSLVTGFLFSASFWCLASVIVSGPRVLSEYPRFLIFESRHPLLAGFEPIDMPNIRGLVTWLTHGRISSAGVATLSIAISIAVLWWTAKQWNEERPALSFASSILAALLVSFHLYNYDLSLLLLPVAVVCGHLARNERLLAVPVITGALIFLFIHPLHVFLLLHGLYALMCIPISVLFLSSARLSRTMSYAKIGTQAGST